MHWPVWYDDRGKTAVILTLALCVVATAAGAQSPVALAGSQSRAFFQPAYLGSETIASVVVNINTPVTLTGLSVTGDFHIAETNCKPPVTLRAGDSCSLQISFVPSAPGLRWSRLLLTGDDGAQYAFGLAGAGLGPAFAFTPGIVSTIAGDGTAGYSGDDGPALAAQLNLPMGIAQDSEGSTYIADFGNNVVRKIRADGTILTVAGNGTQGYSGDGGPAISAQLAYPSAVALDRAGNLYIGDFLNSCIRKVDLNGAISTLAPAFFVRGLAVDGQGNVFFSSLLEGVWKIDSVGNVTRLAGNGNPGYSGDGGPAIEAQTSGVAGLALDTKGNLYFAEIYNSDVRMVDSNGIITTVAGDHEFGYEGDGGPATSARFNGPTDVRIDAAGNLYIVDSSNNRIRKVNASGVISTIAGDGNFGYAGDSGSAFRAQFAGPTALLLDRAGNLVVADTSNNVVRKIRVNSTALDFGEVNVGETGGPQRVMVSNTGTADFNISSILSSSNDFSVQTTCPINAGLQSGEECAIDVTFVPTARGNFSETITVQDGALGSPHMIALTGQGFSLPAASQLLFGNSFPARQLNENLGEVIVNAADATGDIVPSFDGLIILSVQGPSGFVPYSVQSDTAGGSATFDLSALALNAVGSYTVSATSSGLTSALATFEVYSVPVASQLLFGHSFPARQLNDNLGAVIVNATDANGDIVPSFDGAITLSVQGPNGFVPYSGQNNAAAGAATFDLSSLALNVVGSYTVSATSSGLTSAQATFEVVGNPDFRVSTSPDSLEVSQRGAGNINVVVTPMNRYRGSITLSCAGLPSHSTCTFNPATLQLDDGDPEVVTRLTISTGVATVASRQGLEVAPLSLASLTFATGLFGLAFMPLSKRANNRQTARVVQMVLLLLVLGITLVGCGRIGGTEAPSGNTPPGEYTVTVSAASSGVSHSTTFHLSVH